VARAISAPTVSGKISSTTAMSNDSVVTASTTSPSCSPGSRARLCSKLTAARCGMRTPLGLPVEPEV
jgi:hypothetical protein